MKCAERNAIIGAVLAFMFLVLLLAATSDLSGSNDDMGWVTAVIA